MKILEKYTGEKTYMFPNGDVATPEKIENDFPAVSVFTHVIETDENGEVCFAVENLAAMRTMYEIDTGLTEDEAIAAIQEKVNETTDDDSASAEERIAAALEYQNALSE